MATRSLEILQRVLAAQVRHYRKARGLSQQELAEACDLSLDMIGRIERATASPSLESLSRLADALNTSASMLLGGKGIGARRPDRRDAALSDTVTMLAEMSQDDLERARNIIRLLRR